MPLARIAAIVLSAVWPLSVGAAGPAAEQGQVLFNNYCRTCHSPRQGDNRQGPSLYQVVGRKAGSAPGYTAYSASLASSGIVWDEQTVDRFIENPDQVVAGNKMKPFTGIRDEAVRRKI